MSTTVNFDISRTLFLFTAWRYEEYLKSYSYVWTGTLYRVSLHVRFKYLMVFLPHVWYLPVQAKGLNLLWTYRVRYVFLPPEFVSLLCLNFWWNMSQVKSDFLAWWHLVGWRLLGFPQFLAFWKPCFISVLLQKSFHVHFSRLGVPGSIILAVNPFTAQRCLLSRQGFSSSVCQAVSGAAEVSTAKVYQQC